MQRWFVLDGDGFVLCWHCQQFYLLVVATTKKVCPNCGLNNNHTETKKGVVKHENNHSKKSA